MKQIADKLSICAVSSGPTQHLSGHYDRTPWSSSARCMQGMETDFIGRPPRPGETATVGRTDTAERARRVVGEGVLDRDGHCSWSPDRRWILTDTCPDGRRMRTLILYDPGERRRVDVGRFYAPPQLVGPVRCDLHPRWSRDGRRVCIDPAHEGTRQVYALDVSAIVAG